MSDDKPSGDENNGEDEAQQLRERLLEMRVRDFVGLRGVMEQSKRTEAQAPEGKPPPNPIVEIIGAILRPSPASKPDVSGITESQQKVYETMENVSKATGRPSDGGSEPEEFPEPSGDPQYDDDKPVEPTTVTHGTIVTIKGSNLHRIKRIKVGGIKAPIVRRASDELRIMVPEDAEDGCVDVNGNRESRLSLELLHSDGGDQSQRGAV
jgi:hypothetical protein